MLHVWYACICMYMYGVGEYSILYEGPQTFGRRIVLGGLIRLHNLQALFQHRPNSISKMIGDFRIRIVKRGIQNDTGKYIHSRHTGLCGK